MGDIRARVSDDTLATFGRVKAARFGGAQGAGSVAVAWAVAMLAEVLSDPEAARAPDWRAALDAYAQNRWQRP